MGVPISQLELTQHALFRFAERTGLDKSPGYEGPHYAGVLLSLTLAKPEVTVEKFIDTTAGDALTEFYLIPEGRELWPIHLTEVAESAMTPTHRAESAILRSAPALVAVVRNHTVVTLLSFEMYQTNKNAGAYVQPGNRKPLPLSTNTMEQQMTLAKNAREWATSYFSEHPAASVHEALKAANNAGQPPVKSVFSAVKSELRAEAEKQREQARKAELEKAKAVPRSAPAVQSIAPEPKTEAAKVFHDAVVREVREVREVDAVLAHLAVTSMPSAPAAPQNPPSSPEERIRAQAKALLEVMREARMESLILTITDRAPKPNASWEVTYHRSTAGEFDL